MRQVQAKRSIDSNAKQNKDKTRRQKPRKQNAKYGKGKTFWEIQKSDGKDQHSTTLAGMQNTRVLY
jgi:hypothetical protein